MRLTPKIALAVIMVIALFLGAATLAGVDPLDKQQTNSVLHLGRLQAALAAIPPQPLSAEEREGILVLREGTKLAHDAFLAFSQLYDLPVFASNAFNGQAHTEAMGLLVQRYALIDPAAGKAEGQFNLEQLRDLYAKMLEEGRKSEYDALVQSMRLEELGIIYMKNQLARTDNEDLALVYRELLRGAALNLRDFVEANRAIGGPEYEPKQLTLAEFEEVLQTDPAELDESSLLLRATDFGRCGIDDFETPRRREENLEAEEPEDELQQDLCSTVMTIAGPAARTIDIGPRNVVLRLLPTAQATLPAPVDSNSPVLRQGGNVIVFNSWDNVTFRAQGNDVENFAEPVQIQLPRGGRPGHVWLEAVWMDPQTSTLYGWYHLEPSDLPCAPLTAPIVGAAVSQDGGFTWEDRGFVLEAGYDFDCEYRNGFFVGGHGDFSVILGPQGAYFYFLFSNYAGPVEEQGIGVARSAFADRGQPGTAMKYYNGEWNEPGIGGKVTPLFPSSTGWKGPYVEAFWGPSIHWNAAIQSYVALLNHTADDSETWRQEGVYVSFSQDLLQWTPPEKILDVNNWYPQVIGLSQNGTDSYAERYMRLYVGGISEFILELRSEGS